MKLLTTGQVARICRVSPRTAAKWIDHGHLQGFRLPGSQDRRVELTELVKFMVKNTVTVPQYLIDQMNDDLKEIAKKGAGVDETWVPLTILVEGLSEDTLKDIGVEIKSKTEDKEKTYKVVVNTRNEMETLEKFWGTAIWYPSS